MFQSDVTLEKYYSIDGHDNDYPPTSIVWKYMNNVHVYDSTQHVFDLIQNGFVQELEVPTYTNPIVADYFYADFSDYFGITNGQADHIYITRYNGHNSPPPHP